MLSSGYGGGGVSCAIVGVVPIHAVDTMTELIRVILCRFSRRDIEEIALIVYTTYLKKTLLAFEP